LNEVAIAQLFTLMGAHRNSSLADVSCYYLAQQTGRPLLTGDGKLRRQASKDGIPVYGVLWLLDLLVANAIIAPARAHEALQAMLVHGARLPQMECQQRLQQWQ
jgi:predicted nucleic acid-binding protein